MVERKIQLTSLSTPTRIVILAAFYFVGGLLGSASRFSSVAATALSTPPLIAATTVRLLIARSHRPIASYLAIQYPNNPC